MALYVPVQDLANVHHLDPSNALTWLAEGVAYAKTMLVGKGRSDPDPKAWVYAMHEFLALLVADDLARDYVTRRTSIASPQHLLAAEPAFRQQITAVWGPRARLTPRRLAMALVDAKLAHVRPRLLVPRRSAGLQDSSLWSRRLGRARERRLRALIGPNKAVARWYARWRSLMVTCPSADYRFDQVPGEEDLAARVWGALGS